MKLYYFLSYT